jgi:hypothetical protein
MTGCDYEPVASHPHGLLIQLNAIFHSFLISDQNIPISVLVLATRPASPDSFALYYAYRALSYIHCTEQQMHTVKHNEINIVIQLMISVIPTCFGTVVPPSGSLSTQIITSPALHFRYQPP